MDENVKRGFLDFLKRFEVPGPSRSDTISGPTINNASHKRDMLQNNSINMTDNNVSFKFVIHLLFVSCKKLLVFLKLFFVLSWFYIFAINQVFTTIPCINIFKKVFYSVYFTCTNINLAVVFVLFLFVLNVFFSFMKYYMYM